MINSVQGVLITTDIPTKQLIMFLNQENQKRIVLKDLDDYNVLVDPSYVDYLKAEVEKTMEQNMFIRQN